MKLVLKSLSAVALSLGISSAFAAPTFLTMTNNTQEQSNAFIAGTIPSAYPTAPNSTGKVYWNLVRLACYGHTTPDGKCPAVIKMATDTPNPITIATVAMDLASGEITVQSATGQGGYLFTVKGPGMAEVNKIK
jgi:hypothetical protein